MLTLKESIMSHIKNEFFDKNMDNNEKIFLGNLIFKKILDGDYYKNNYYITSINLCENNVSYINLNPHHLTSRRSFESLYTVEHDVDILDTYNSDIKKHIFSKEVFSRIKRFTDIVSKYSSSVDEYTNKLIEAHKGDSEFISTIQSFGHLFDGEKNRDLFFPEEVNFLMNKKGMDSIKSTLCKSKKNFKGYETIQLIKNYEENNFGEKEIQEDCQKKWDRNTIFRKDCINSVIENMAVLDDYYDHYEKEIAKIVDIIKEERPLIFKSPELNDIHFSFFETKKIHADDENYFNKNIELEENFCISEEKLKERGISIDDVYQLPNKKYDPDTYEDFEESFYNQLFNKKNEISSEISDKFFGFDFWGESILKQNDKNNSYILAKHNDEVIGFLSFSSSETNLIKSIEYVSIKENFRGMGLAEKMYDNLMFLLNHHDYVLTTSCYSDEGGTKLPKLKDRVKSKYPELMMMNMANGDLSYLTKTEEELQKFKNKVNRKLIQDILLYEKKNSENINLKLPELRKFLRTTLRKIDENKDLFCKSGDELLTVDSQTRFIRDTSLELISIIETPFVSKKITMKAS